MNLTKLFSVVPLVGVLVGCAPSYVNLTPRSVPRRATDVYPFEVEWKTRRTGANNAAVRAYVVIDDQLYPLARVPNTENRFEGSAPISANRVNVPYKFKLDYQYPGLPERIASSDWSPEYRLTLPGQP
jgi:hypothetical protein